MTTVLATKPIANPLGLAPGLDKNAALVDLWPAFGFGFLELGSVTAKPWTGNAKPRLFRLPDDYALINRMGLNGLGKEVFAKRMEVRKTTLPVGVNIAKTNDPSIGGEQAIEDILATFLQVKSTNPAYIAINASCPNTSEGIWSSIEQLDRVLEAIAKANDQHIPIFVKVSPDSSDELLKAIVDCAKAKGICGFICGNTTRFRPIRYTPASIYKEIGDGGLSGGPLKDINLDLVSRVYKLTGNSMEIIAVGGIMSGNDAYDYVLAGASSFQVYTGLIYYGPGLCYEILKSLEEKLLSKDQTLITARGLNTREAVA